MTTTKTANLGNAFRGNKENYLTRAIKKKLAITEGLLKTMRKYSTHDGNTFENKDLF